MRLTRTELGELSCFAAVARHRSFKLAGKELSVSPSALSHTLRSLEERLGVRLLNRTTRVVVPTQAGEELLERLEPALRGIGEALETVKGFRNEVTGTLRLNMPGTAAWLVFAPIISGFLKRHPHVRVEIIAEERFVDVVAAGFDAGIRFGDTVPKDMVAVRIGFEHRFAVVGSPDYFERHPKPASPADLIDHPCIRWAFTAGGYLKWHFEKDGKVLMVDPDGPLAANESNLIRRAALDGVGLAYQLDHHLAEELASGRLIRVLEDWCPSRPGFSLYYPSRRQVPLALRALIESLKEHG